MISRRWRIVFAVTMMTLVTACGGLDPGDLPPDSTISGTIVFAGGAAAWPPADSIREVRVVVFDTVPRVESDVIASVLRGTALFTDPLPQSVDSAVYSLLITAPPRRFEYIVVAALTGPNVFTDWTMLAVHAPVGRPQEPIAENISVGDQRTINFVVRFDSLPPQPFE